MNNKMTFHIGLLAATMAIVNGGNLSNCRGGCDGGEACVGNPHSQPVTDSQCSKCSSGQEFWPCNFETICFCNSAEANALRIPPAPKSGVRVSKNVTDPCNDLFSEEMFEEIVQPKTPEAKALFTYNGFCSAIRQYNNLHDEKFAQMGTEEQMRAELAAFLAHTAADTFGYSTIREELHCVDPITTPTGEVYCKPCKEQFFDKVTGVCSTPHVTADVNYTDYCDDVRMGKQGCNCKDVPLVDIPATNASAAPEGYIDSSQAYFSRGALALSWNYDYFAASVALGLRNDLCQDPDLVARVPEYAWGVGIYRWMDQMIFGTTGSTAHQQILKLNFEGTIEVLYGELECPAQEWASQVHLDMVFERVKGVCKAGAAIGVHMQMNPCGRREENCLECKGLQELYEACLESGACPACDEWTKFAKSVAPTPTRVRIEPPSNWGDWEKTRGTNGAVANTHVHFVITAAFSALLAAFGIGMV